jgi:hypothetical protein
MLVTLVVCPLLIIVAVVVHYESLVGLHAFLNRLRYFGRRRLVGVLGALLAHLVEIALFAVSYALLAPSGRYGQLHGPGNWQGTASDYLYYSAVAYTSLGFGDVTPTGHLRILTAVETLTGLVLVAFTASFLYTSMQLYWGEEKANSDHQEVQEQSSRK